MVQNGFADGDASLRVGGNYPWSWSTLYRELAVRNAKERHIIL